MTSEPATALELDELEAAVRTEPMSAEQVRAVTGVQNGPADVECLTTAQVRQRLGLAARGPD